MRGGKLAILVPVFNAGALLAQTVASAAQARLPPDRYEILVLDNASTDGSVAALPTCDRVGVPITVYRNGANLGRVENWNVAAGLAREMGFGAALFLMAGDMIRDASVIALCDRMAAAGAALGLASYEVVDASLRPLRLARRIVWHGGAIAPGRLLSQSIAVGAALFGPLNANVYDLRAAALAFDPADPSHTDHAATIAFLRAANRPIVYLDRPITRWRQRDDRFHAGMDLQARFAADLALIQAVCADAGLTPDDGKIGATFALRALFHRRGNSLRVLTGLRRHVPMPICWRWMVMLALRQIVHGTPWRIAA